MLTTVKIIHTWFTPLASLAWYLVVNIPTHPNPYANTRDLLLC